MPNAGQSVAGARRPDLVVTGAPGWLATRLIELLRDPGTRAEHLPSAEFEDAAIRCLVLPSADASILERVHGGVEVCRGDLTAAEDVRALCRGTEGATLFHVAGLIHPARRTRDLWRVNVDGTRNLLDAAVAAGVKRVVVVSSNSPIGCNPDPRHVFDERAPYAPYMAYGRSKMEMERVVHAAQASGRIETVVVRPPWFYGPHQPPRQTLFFQMIKAGRFPLLGDGEQRRSMAYVDNICQGLLLAATSARANGQTYWIADERPYSVNEIVTTVEDVLVEELGIARPAKRLRLPRIVGTVAMAMDASLQAVGLYDQKIHVLGEMDKTIACSIAKARAELGYAPRIALREGMRRSVRWCVANGYAI